MKTATQILKEEHQNILKFIAALIKETDAIKAGKEINADFFEKAIDFIREYADKFHHSKEEDILFKEFESHSAEAHCNPVQQMLYEHNLGRDFRKEIEEGLKENNKDKIIKSAVGYADLLKDHIFKEDNILYPMIEEILSKPIQDDISKRFDEKEKFKPAITAEFNFI